ncbi:hypothetical protein BJ875DRAFT_161456 [Amylocarpus encephaloides]|uniref:Uncharacterized protein n=1 Tax=Amylocarpus encephaloides TaxID=45428 RepID=A0A9P7YAS9_9HELO|nr:hypothetical protein BJ875DRAFT_161456 [Amylocarpus encephaloides]
MHSLHCLNAVRKGLYPQYYKNHNKANASEFEQLLHIDHCIEQLRQVIQCGGDLTPVSLRQYGKEGQKSLIGTPQIHTCRDWAAFREWYLDKGTEWGNLVWTGI